MTTVTEDGGRTNLYAKEPPMTIMDRDWETVVIRIQHQSFQDDA